MPKGVPLTEPALKLWGSAPSLPVLTGQSDRSPVLSVETLRFLLKRELAPGKGAGSKPKQTSGMP